MVDAGSFIALGSSLAMRSAVGGALLGSAVAPVVAIGAGVTAGVAAITAGVVATQSWLDGDLPTRLRPFTIARHEFGPVRFQSFETLEEAEAAWAEFKDSPTRRILFHLVGTSVVHGVTRDWQELKHAGAAPWVDNGVREVVKRALEAEA